MKVLIEIVHPADVLFYRRPIQMLEARGDTVRVVSRHKDVACDLLDGFGIVHRPISTAGYGTIGLARELLQREAALIPEVRQFRPQVMLGFGGVAISHVGRLTRVPTAIHYDSENARLQTRLAWPFVDSLTVPAAYTGVVPESRTRRIPGIKELSFFLPGAFYADHARAIAAGLDPDRPNVVIRLVEWRANHDIGKCGWSEAEGEAVVKALAPKAKLHVSAEGRLPSALAPFRYTGNTADIHHLMAFSDALVGESATMACEAVALGIPALYAGRDFPGYTEGLALDGLISLVRPTERSTLVERALALLEDRQEFDACRAKWLKECPDWAEDVIAEADRMACAPW